MDSLNRGSAYDEIIHIDRVGDETIVFMEGICTTVLDFIASGLLAPSSAENRRFCEMVVLPTFLFMDDVDSCCALIADAVTSLHAEKNKEDTGFSLNYQRIGPRVEFRVIGSDMEAAYVACLFLTMVSTEDRNAVFSLYIPQLIEHYGANRQRIMDSVLASIGKHVKTEYHQRDSLRMN